MSFSNCAGSARPYNGETTVKAQWTKLAIAIVLLAACGGDGGYSPTTPPTPAPPVASIAGGYSLVFTGSPLTLATLKGRFCSTRCRSTGDLS